MPRYVRVKIDGGIFFFIVALIEEGDTRAFSGAFGE
jgi:hypothetical protein